MHICYLFESSVPTGAMPLASLFYKVASALVLRFVIPPTMPLPSFSSFPYNDRVPGAAGHTPSMTALFGGPFPHYL